MKILLVGGTFNLEGGRPSGYFGKLAQALVARIPYVDHQLLNGGHFEQLQAALAAAAGVTHLLWFSDVPNELPKLLPVLTERYPGLVLVSSKNNRKNLYGRDALYERMRRSRSELLVEFGEGAGALVASVLAVHGEVLLETSADINEVAECLAQQFVRLSALVFPLAKAPFPTVDSESFKIRSFNEETEIPLRAHVGAFGVSRRNHVHEGVDLYGVVGDSVLAMEPGVVIATLPFTGVLAGSMWWDETSCILVRGASGCLNYGELTVAAGLTEGSVVAAGQVLGHLAQVLLEDKGRPMTMLHLERYCMSASAPVKEWPLEAPQPPTLCDPTTLLLQAAGNASTAGAGRRKRVCIVGERGFVSQALQERLTGAGEYTVSVVSTDSVLAGESKRVTDGAELLVLCTQEFSSPQVVAELSPAARVLDVSPAFRTAAGWVYGLPELAGARERIAAARRVANPGCFATSAILILEPLVRRSLLEPGAPVYLDGAGGFTTGGSAMVEKEAAGQLAGEAVFSLTREHRHVTEIKQVVGLTGPVMFSPKIAKVPRGIRMQVPLFGISASDARQTYQTAYAGTAITVEESGPSRVAVDDWAGREGACIRVYEQPEGCLVVCTIDNMGKGAVDSAFDNIGLMLG